MGRSVDAQVSAVRNWSGAFRTAAVLVVIWVVFAAFPGATGIVVLLRPDGIYVAADSTVLNADLKKVRSDLCKIVPGRKVVIALAGTTAGRFAQRNVLTGETKLGDSFNLFELARQAVQGAESVDEAIATFERLSLPILDRIVQQDGGTALDTQQRQSGAVAQAVVAAYRSGAAEVVLIDYRRQLQAGRPGRVVGVQTRCPPTCPINGLPMAVGQVDETIYSAWLTLAPDIRADPVRTAERLLTEQAKALEAQGHTDFIAPPFDVIRISLGRLDWKVRKDTCAAIER